MVVYKFKRPEVVFNTLKLHPSNKFDIYNSKVYYNNYWHHSASFTSQETLTPSGHISLYEINVDRNEDATGLIYPFVTKNGDGAILNTVTTKVSSVGYNVGDIISGSYPMSSSIIYNYLTTTLSASALKNTLTYNKRLSNSFDYSNFESVNFGLISIPSIFYGSSMKKGTVNLRFYLSGTLLAEASDERQNGQIIQIGPEGSTNSGSVVGVVLYKEGFLLLTSSVALSTGHSEGYVNDVGGANPQWRFFGAGANAITPPSLDSIPSSSFQLSFSGTTFLPNYTLFCRAPRGTLNSSTNPTFVTYGGREPQLSSGSVYSESVRKVKNVVSSSLVNTTASFDRTTFISSIGIYDKDRELIGVAKLATPVKKMSDVDLTFKIKFDM
jgi:hypothetical protein